MLSASLIRWLFAKFFWRSGIVRWSNDITGKL
jgi:hypothetical protein